MKFLPLLALMLSLACAAPTLHAQTAADLMTEGQRAYSAGDMETAKAKFQLVLEVERNHKTARNYLRMIQAAEARAGVGGVLQKQLQTVVLPKVELRDTTFGATLDYLKQQTAKASDGKVNVSFVSQLPADFMNTQTVTLNLAQVPLTEVLRYVGDLAGVQFSIEKHAVVVKKKGPPAVEEGAAAGPTSTLAQ